MPGFTCCVPGCFNNNKKEKQLKYYKFPKDPKEKRIWVTNIGRVGDKGKFSLFTPTTGHRVCSTHFEGGLKTYMVNRPTVFPLKPSSNKISTRRTIPRKKDAAEHMQTVKLHGRSLFLAPLSLAVDSL